MHSVNRGENGIRLFRVVPMGMLKAVSDSSQIRESMTHSLIVSCIECVGKADARLFAGVRTA